MPDIYLRPADPDRDFARLAAFFTILEDWPNTEEGLRGYYERERERITHAVALDETGELLGFYWATRDRTMSERAEFSLYVRPERRGEGAGRALYDAMVDGLVLRGVKTLRVAVWDNCPAGRAFADRRGYAQLSHHIAMALDLRTFDDGPYEAIITRLESEGFRFTSMGDLGDTEEAQRNLYRLNDANARDIPGTTGESSWTSFEDFRQRVCQADWYKPHGQMVAIDMATGTWAAMSAITRPVGAAFAYNLHTGVARAYRGRKLAQAVKVRALRFARDVLGVGEVRTHHTVQNLPMIAIDRKLGYVRRPGTYLMDKTLG